MNKIKNNFIMNPGSFYTLVNSKRKSTGFPSFMKFADKKSCSVDVICDLQISLPVLVIILLTMIQICTLTR